MFVQFAAPPSIFLGTGEVTRVGGERQMEKMSEEGNKMSLMKM